MKSKFKLWKLAINLTLVTMLSIVLYQNVIPVKVELLLWEIEMPLTFLLLILALLGALITFFTVLMVGSRK